MSDDLAVEIVREHWLYAFGGPERLEVVRSVELRDTDDWYAPVSAYVRDNGLVRAASETFDDEDFMFGRCEMSVYVPPQVRNGVLAGTEISVPWFAAAGAE